MRSEWTTSQDLLMPIDGAGGRREAVEEALRDAVRAGRLRPGARLPSTRALAADLDLARGTVTQAYEQLVAEGWLVARQGSGTVVADLPGRQPTHVAARALTPPDPRHDLRPGSPDVSAFPRAAWAAAMRRVLRDAPDRALGYGDPLGAPQLRAELASYVGRARGVRTAPEHIVVCSGWSQALCLVAEVLRASGARAVALEDPCNAAYRDAVARTGIHVCPLAVDADGADPAALLEFDDVAAVVLTPAHQYPTGTTLAPARRAAFVEWARARDGLLLEDDYDGELRYDRQPVGALQGLDPERVVYAGTVSKSLAPALRLAWMAVPAPLVEPLREAKRLTDRQTPTLDQLALADLLARGTFDRHLRAMRARYRRRRDLLVAAVRERTPQLAVEGIAAGLHVVVRLPTRGPSEPAALAALADAGVAVHGLSGYAHRPDPRVRGLVVGYGTPPEHAYPAAIDALTTTLARLVRRRPARAG